MIPVGVSISICVHYYHSCSNDPRWHEQDYMHPPYHRFIHCRHRNDGPHLCEDIRLYPVGNLNASVCLLPSFLIYVSLKRLIIDGASIVMSMLSTLHREQPNCTSPCSNFLLWSYLQFPKWTAHWEIFSNRTAFRLSNYYIWTVCLCFYLWSLSEPVIGQTIWVQ